jgi:hypothetical protein
MLKKILDDTAIREKMLLSYIDAIVFRGIGERFNVGPLLLSYLFEYLSSCSSKYFTGSKAYQFLKTINYPVGKNRPLHVLGYFNEALIVFKWRFFLEGQELGNNIQERYIMRIMDSLLP